MEHSVRLCELREGECGRVLSTDLAREMRRRVQCLGLSPGSLVSCYAYAPSGDPGAYRIRETTIALRRSDAEKIRVRPVKAEWGRKV